MLLIPYLLPYPYPLNLYLLPTCPAAPTCPLPPLCRALKTKGNTPKYGLIYHSSFIGRAQVSRPAGVAHPRERACALRARRAGMRNNQKQHYERFMTCAATNLAALIRHQTQLLSSLGGGAGGWLACGRGVHPPAQPR